jgi:DNA-binding transcriptional LysR family regulator
MAGTIRIDDMRLFAKVAEARSFTSAARLLGIPKQTLSRRVADLELALGVQLMHRTTRRLHLTDVGAAYAERCAEVARIADEANRAVSDANDVPRGTLRVTADPVFGEAFLSGLVIEYARRWPEVDIDVVLTRRRVDMIEEGFDVAFRIGQVDDPALSGFSLGPARVRYCASPAYIARHGAPATPDGLAAHECILVASEGGPVRWPFRGKNGTAMVPVSGRLRMTSFTMARAAALAGVGIAIFPEFACAEDISEKRLVPVLEEWVVDVGAVWVVHAARRFLSTRVRAFADLARERFAREPPWLAARSVNAPKAPRARSKERR